MENNQPVNASALNVPNMEMLQKMRQVAAMRDHADQMGTGFIGGFVDDDGRVYMQTNLEDESDVIARAYVKNMLNLPEN